MKLAVVAVLAACRSPSPASPDATAPDARSIDGAPAGGYATDFPAGEDPLRDHGAWVVGKSDGLDWNDPMTTPGHAYASVESGNPNRYNDSIGHLTTTFGSAQWAQATVFRAADYDPGAPVGHEVELLLRFHIAPHDAHGYEVMWGASGYLAVVRWNGPLGDYTPLYDPGLPGIGKAVEGDVLRAEITGTTLTVYMNATLVATVDITVAGGTVWDSGQPGIGFWPVDGAIVDRYGWKHFEAGS